MPYTVNYDQNSGSKLFILLIKKSWYNRRIMQKEDYLMMEAVSSSETSVDIYQPVQVVHWNSVSEPPSPAGLLFIRQMIYEYGEPQWHDTDRGNRRTRRKTCPSATLSTTNPTWTDPGPNPIYQTTLCYIPDDSHLQAKGHLQPLTL
jgi:hypothetical protein